MLVHADAEVISLKGPALYTHATFCASFLLMVAYILSVFNLGLNMSVADVGHRTRDLLLVVLFSHNFISNLYTTLFTRKLVFETFTLFFKKKYGASYHDVEFDQICKKVK